MGMEVLPDPSGSGANTKAKRQQFGGYYSGIDAVGLVILPWYYRFVVSHRRDGYA